MRWSGCCAASAAGTTQAARFGMGRALPQRRRERRRWTLFRSGGQRQLLQRWRPAAGRRSWLPTSRRGLDVVAGRVLWHVWRAGERGIHRNTLCQRTDLTPVELRSLLIRMGRVLQEVPAGAGHGVVAAGGGQQPVAELFHGRRLCRGGVRSVRGEDAGPAVQWLAAPLTTACHTAPGRTNRASVVEHAAADGLPGGVMLACGGGQLRRPYGASLRQMHDGHQHHPASA